MQKVDGVEAYLDYKSIPGANNIMPAFGGFEFPEELFCSGKVLYYHQPVGIIIANETWVGMQATSKVKIYYSTPTETPLLNIPDVLKAKATDRIKVTKTFVATRKG